MSEIIEVNGIDLTYQTPSGNVRAVENVDYSVEEKEIVGLVGESGCGKTTLGKGSIKLLPDNGFISDGSIRFKDHDITDLPEKEMKDLRWDEISFIPQNAMNALDPVYRIGSQMREVIQTHTDLSKQECNDRIERLLEDVNLDPQRMKDYPHALSGGQRQRVVIALALALDPALVVADEPTTGLDVVVQDEILDLLKQMQTESGFSMIFISHDINVISEISNRVGVMYAGQLVEMGDTESVLERSAHPYTMGLRRAFPSLDKDISELISMPGNPPELRSPPTGCRFKDRCPFATQECDKEPLLESVESEMHQAKCHYVERREEFMNKSGQVDIWTEE